MPAFYQQRNDWLGVMRQAIALNASHFNTQRMVQEYVTKAYFE
jgi:starch phosphorylase